MYFKKRKYMHISFNYDIIRKKKLANNDFYSRLEYHTKPIEILLSTEN